MTNDFECLRCPMCGGELIYSDGTHDLCCKNNKQELENAGATGGQDEEAAEKKAHTLHETRDGYGSAFESKIAPCEEPAVESGKQAVEKPDDAHACVFAISFTESGRNGTLWSVRIVHGETNYFSLGRLLDKIEKRQRRGEPIAANVANLPRKVERSPACQLAFRYRLDVEDLYSIKYSSETRERLAIFYGISERDIAHIKTVDMGEGME